MNKDKKFWENLENGLTCYNCRKFGFQCVKTTVKDKFVDYLLVNGKCDDFDRI